MWLCKVFRKKSAEFLLKKRWKMRTGTLCFTLICDVTLSACKSIWKLKIELYPKSSHILSSSRGRSHGIFDQWERRNRAADPIRERLPAWLVQWEVEPSFRQPTLALLGVFWSAKLLVIARDVAKITERRPIDLPVIYKSCNALFKITACTAEGIKVQNCKYFLLLCIALYISNTTKIVPSSLGVLNAISTIICKLHVRVVCVLYIKYVCTLSNWAWDMGRDWVTR